MNRCVEPSGDCEMVQVREGLSCDDGNKCIDGERCASGFCNGGAGIDCDDDNLCTDDSCNPSTGCVNVENSVVCADARCEAGTFYPAVNCLARECPGQVGQPCGDGDVCTDDGCDVNSGCTYGFNNAQCDDGDPCTKNDTCAGGECAGTAYSCGDNDECTRDVCDGVGGCSYPIRDDVCVIDGACHQSGDRFAGDACIQCIPGESQYQWSPVPNGSILPDAPILYLDGDDDGYGDPDSFIRACGTVDGYVGVAGDCDDGAGDVHPGADDLVDGSCAAASDTFLVSSLDAAGSGYASIGIGPDGVHHISYMDATSHVRYMTNAGGSWTGCQISVTTGLPSRHSMVVDAAGVPHILFRDSTGKNMQHAWGGIGAWQYEAVTPVNGFGSEFSMVMAPEGKLHVAYRDYATGFPAHATNASGTWISEIVDTAGVAYDTSIAVDGDGKVHIAYAKTPNGGSTRRLQYATNKSGTWVSTEIYNNGETGLNSSIGVSSSGVVSIAFFDYTMANLGFSTNATGTWVTTMPDSGGDTGVHPALVIDGAGFAHIAYQGDFAVGKPLRYVTNATGNWVLKQADVGVASNMDLALDREGRIHIAYIRDGLRYATDCAEYALSGDANCGV